MQRLVLLIVLAVTGSGVTAVDDARSASSGYAATRMLSDHSPPPASDPPAAGRFVVFMPDDLTPGFAAAVTVIDGVSAVSVTSGATLHIASTSDRAGNIVDQPRPGYVIPVQAFLFDGATYGRFFDTAAARTISGLGPNEVVLGAGSARIRRLGVGGRITFADGMEVTVAAVLDDEAVRYAEVVAVNPDLFALARPEARSALVAFDGDGEQLTAALETVLPAGEAFRVRSLDPTPADRRGLVRSQVFLKQVFGEFAYRPTGGGQFRIDPNWTRDNIVAVTIPLLGATWCHRVFADLLTEVTQGLIDDGLRNVIDRSGFRGCWNPRYIANSTRLSRHAWGIAADINFGNSLRGGPGSPVNEDLLGRMAALGITSGHAWTNPDPGHFEFYGFDWLDPAGTVAMLEGNGRPQPV